MRRGRDEHRACELRKGFLRDASPSSIGNDSSRGLTVTFAGRTDSELRPQFS